MPQHRNRSPVHRDCPIGQRLHGPGPAETVPSSPPWTVPCTYSPPRPHRHQSPTRADSRPPATRRGAEDPVAPDAPSKPGRAEPDRCGLGEGIDDISGGTTGAASSPASSTASARIQRVTVDTRNGRTTTSAAGHLRGVLTRFYPTWTLPADDGGARQMVSADQDLALFRIQRPNRWRQAGVPFRNLVVQQVRTGYSSRVCRAQPAPRGAVLVADTKTVSAS